MTLSRATIGSALRPEQDEMMSPTKGRLAVRGRALGLVAVAALSLGCPGQAKTVVYDLAERMPVAERWSSRDVLLFGTPAAEPSQAEGFYREAVPAAGDSFVWAREAAEISLNWAQASPRAAVVDLAPYEGVRAQSAEVFLNGAPIARFALNDLRHRYRFEIPALAQKPGENRLRFAFGQTATPAVRDPQSEDRRRLAAAFYSLVVGPAEDQGLQDLLARDAPPVFTTRTVEAAPAARGRPAPAVLTQVGPSVLRFAVRLPERAELRFTPELHPSARAAATSASFRVTLEERAGEEREVWARVLGPRDGKLGEVVVPLPGAAGAIARVGLHVGGPPGGRFPWGIWNAPRILGRGGFEAQEAAALPPDQDRRADALRPKLAGMNVLFVILDAGRAQQFGTYGYPRATTPEIDRMAKEGAVFEDVFTSAVYTNAAMSSVWTSQYPDRHHGDVSFSAPLPTDRLTLPDVLTGQGIYTGGFVANAVAGGLNGFGRGFDEFHETWRELGSRGDVFRQALPGWFKANRARRFFAYVHFREPHYPYDPEPPFDTRFGPDGPIPKASRRDQAFFTAINQGRRPLSPEEREHLVRLYDGNLAFADQEVGEIRRTLEAEGLWDKTVVILAADHGEGLFEHGWIGHNVQLYEQSLRIPLIIRFPRTTGLSAMRVKGLADLLDLAPTIADIFGVRGKGGSDRAFQGRSLLPLLFGAPGKGLVLSRTVWERPRYSLRDPRFKFIYDTRTGQEELYDLQQDPGEGKPLGESERLRAAYYRQALHHWTSRLGSHEVGAGGSPRGLTREQCENLKALGYVTADTKCPES